MLVHAAAETGGVATQNRGTIGGNIANASPAADTPPALLVYDAELELLSASGARRIAYRTFHTGYKKMDLRPGEIISRVLSARASTAAGAISTARSARGARRRSRRSASPDRSRWTSRSSATSASRSAASRRSCSGVRRLKPRCADGRLTDRLIADAQAALARGHRADRRHPLDRAVSPSRRAESPERIPAGFSSPFVARVAAATAQASGLPSRDALACATQAYRLPMMSFSMSCRRDASISRVPGVMRRTKRSCRC